MNFDWINPKSNIERSNIQDIEKYFDIRLPVEFVDFIMENNGVEPVRKTINFKVGEDEETEDIKSFLSFSLNDKNYILKTYEENAAFLRPKIVPFAETNYIDLICFDYREKSSPTIIYWNYEISWEVASNERIEGQQFYKICNNFYEFLELFE